MLRCIYTNLSLANLCRTQQNSQTGDFFTGDVGNGDLDIFTNDDKYKNKARAMKYSNCNVLSVYAPSKFQVHNVSFMVGGLTFCTIHTLHLHIFVRDVSCIRVWNMHAAILSILCLLHLRSTIPVKISAARIIPIIISSSFFATLARYLQRFCLKFKMCVSICRSSQDLTLIWRLFLLTATPSTDNPVRLNF